MKTRRHVRRGVTLLEVLVAMFVMAIGMLALLTLFPLGALSMGQALKDDRCAQTAAQADAFLRQYWKAHYLEQQAAGREPTDDTAWAMDDPNLLWMGNHEIQFTFPWPADVYVAQYHSPPAAYPNGRLLPALTSGGIVLGPAGALSAYPPLPGSLPSLLPMSFTVEPSRVAPNPPPFYQQPVLPPQFRYTGMGVRPGTVVRPGSVAPVAVPSYPVLVDPIGYSARVGSMGQVWTAGMPGELQPDPAGSPFQYALRIPRRTVGLNPGANPANPGRVWVQQLQSSSGSPFTYGLMYKPGGPFWAGASDPRLYNPSLAFQTAAMTDDLTYEPNGSPPPGGVVTRQGRYTWSAVLQRPRNDAVGVSSLTILVYDGRIPSVATPGDEAMVYPDVNITPGDRQLQITLPARTPDQSALLRRGGWIMDGTIHLAPPPLAPADGIRNAHFYRINGVTEIGTTATGAVQYVVDIDPPFKGPVPPPINPPLGGPGLPRTQLYLFAGLAEVFERPVLKIDDKFQP